MDSVREIPLHDKRHCNRVSYLTSSSLRSVLTQSVHYTTIKPEQIHSVQRTHVPEPICKVLECIVGYHDCLDGLYNEGRVNEGFRCEPVIRKSGVIDVFI